MYVTARMHTHIYSSIISMHIELKSVPLLSYMTLLEISSLEEGTSKEKGGWGMVVVLVVVVEVAAQTLAAGTFVQGRKAAGLATAHYQECTKAHDCECCTPSKNWQTRGNLAGTNREIWKSCCNVMMVVLLNLWSMKKAQLVTPKTKKGEFCSVLLSLFFLALRVLNIQNTQNCNQVIAKPGSRRDIKTLLCLQLTYFSPLFCLFDLWDCISLGSRKQHIFQRVWTMCSSTILAIKISDNIQSVKLGVH